MWAKFFLPTRNTLAPVSLVCNYPRAEDSPDYWKIVTPLCYHLPVVIRTRLCISHLIKINENEQAVTKCMGATRTPRCNVKPAGAIALGSNPTTGKPPFHAKLEQAGEITHAVSPSLTLRSSNTETRRSLAPTHVSNTGAPPNTCACTQTPCTDPVSCCCHGVPTLSKWFPYMFPLQCKTLISCSTKRAGTGTLGMLPPQWKISHLTTQVRSVSESYYLRSIQGMLGGTSTLSPSYKTNFHAINLYLPFIQ